MALLHIVLFASFVGVALAAEWNCSATSGEYTLSSDCVVSSQVEVTGILSITGVVNASGVLPRVIGGGSNRLFYVQSGGNLTIRSLNLTGGNATDNHQPDNHAGAVYVDSGIFTAFNSSIYGNKALYSGALYAKDGATVRLEGTVVGFNRALTNPGGIYIKDSATSFEMIGGMIENNVGSTSSAGGGITCGGGSHCILLKVVIRNNIAGSGAGIFVGGAFIQVIGCRIEYNGGELTNSGGGIQCWGGVDGIPLPAICNISNTIFRYNKASKANHAPWYGGGGLAAGGNVDVYIYESSFIFNEAKNQGNEIKSIPSGGKMPTVTIVNSYFANPNSAYRFGGACNVSHMNGVLRCNKDHEDCGYCGTQICDSNPCTVFPFTGRCTNRTGNLGVLCDYGDEAICYPGDFKKIVTETALPPPSDYCQACAEGQYTTAQNLPVCSTCNIPPEGNVTVREDCVQRTQIVVRGDLNVTGILDADGQLPAVVGGGSNRHFFVKAGGHLVIRSLNLTGGDVSVAEENGGSVLVDAGRFTAFDSVLTRNRGWRGGAVAAKNKGTIIINSTNVTHNEATRDLNFGVWAVSGGGGGLYLYSSTLRLHKSRISYNNAGNTQYPSHNGFGGGILAFGDISCNFSASSIHHNDAVYGGGLYLTTDNIVFFFQIDLSHNKARWSGGGMYLWTATVHVSNSSINGNIGGSQGAGIYAYSDESLYSRHHIVLSNVVVSQNTLNTEEQNYWGGGGVYLNRAVSLFARESLFDRNLATNDQGHQIMTLNGSTGTPSLKLVNTNFTHVSSTGNFYGYQENIGSPDKFIPPQTCASNPCNVFPFTGTCTNRTGNLGVFCNYDEATTCPANEYKQFVSVENGLPPSTAICATTKPEWDCSASKGVFKRTEDCYMSGQVVLTGDLNIVGRENVYTKLVAAPNSRHFLIDSGTPTLTLRWLNMTGGSPSGNGGSVLISYNVDAHLRITHCIFYKNSAGSAYSGGAISAMSNDVLVSLMNAKFVKNSCGVSGGAIHFYYGTFNGYNVQYIQNNAGSHGGGLFYSCIKPTSINSSVFTLNKAENRGGGIYIHGAYCHSSILAIMRTTFRHNKQTTGIKDNYGGGGIYIDAKVAVSIRESLIIENKAEAQDFGHQIMTYNSSHGTPSITLINTKFVPHNTSNFYGYDDTTQIAGIEQFIPPTTCTPTLCTSNGYTNPICVNKANPNEGVTCFVGCQPGKYGANVYACHDCPTGMGMEMSQELLL
eukprot:g3417.t1